MRLLLVVLPLTFPGIVQAQDSSRIDWPRYQDMAVELMQQYLRINTSNPPGNEIEAARFFKKIFDQHGIESEIFENVIPNTATCNLDVRLLPGEAPGDFLKALKAVIADPSIKIENINQFKKPNTSPINTELFSLIARKTKENHPAAIVTTKMLSGYTESQLFRQLGIVAYG